MLQKSRTVYLTVFDDIYGHWMSRRHSSRQRAEEFAAQFRKVGKRCWVYQCRELRFGEEWRTGSWKVLSTNGPDDTPLGHALGQRFKVLIPYGSPNAEVRCRRCLIHWTFSRDHALNPSKFALDIRRHHCDPHRLAEVREARDRRRRAA